RLLRRVRTPGRTDHEGQTLVLRVVRTSEGQVHDRRYEFESSRRRDRPDEGSGGLKGDLADLAEPEARRQLPLRQIAAGHRLQVQRGALNGMDAHAAGANAGRVVYSYADGQNTRGRPVLGVLWRRDWISIGPESTALTTTLLPR